MIGVAKGRRERLLLVGIVRQAVGGLALLVGKRFRKEALALSASTAARTSPAAWLPLLLAAHHIF